MDLSNYLDKNQLFNHLQNVLGNNAVASIHVDETLATEAHEFLDNLKKDHIQEYRLTIKRHLSSENTEISTSINEVDHLKQFENYVLGTMALSDILKEELQKIMEG